MRDGGTWATVAPEPIGRYKVDGRYPGLRECALPTPRGRRIIADVTNPRTLTRDQRRSIAYNCALVAELRRDPKRVLAVARRNLRRLGDLHPFAAPTLALWEQALALPLDGLAEKMVATDEEACEMRHVSPFAGLLDAATRSRVIREFQATDGTP